MALLAQRALKLGWLNWLVLAGRNPTVGLVAEAVGLELKNPVPQRAGVFCCPIPISRNLTTAQPLQR